MTYEEILQYAPYGVPREKKRALLTRELVRLTEHHRTYCGSYRRILDAFGTDTETIVHEEEIPFLPVRLFKELDLCSVPRTEIVKTMTSSGTTGQRVSKIFLDRETASRQQKTLVRIVTSVTGNVRMPMIILDAPSVLKDRAMFSARGAGILGFSLFGRQRIYALDDDMRLPMEALRTFIEEHRGEKILLFGFTFMVWTYFVCALERSGIHLPLENAILIHGGGWKKLVQEAVSATAFKERLRAVCGISQVVDYYGMVEQTGCIYMECAEGHLHASTYADVIVRRPRDFSAANHGERGILQTVSLLPHSYPGHSLLTDDEAVILGEDDCPCGRMGKYFHVLGRLPHAELRGCSDTYAAEH